MDGILNIYKEAGYTSHDVVAKLRGILHQKKIGHTGTLDPAATGVLPVCCGKATKVCELLTDKDKTYQTICRLGVSTDTQDMTGKILEEHSVKEITEEQLRETVASFVGDIMQVPPMYSAIKIGGKKLYELAREGKEVVRQPRPVKIYNIEILQINLEDSTFMMEVTCSKGTYIRTLCHDIGEKLGVGAAMQQLIRTRVDVFGIKNAITLEQVENLVKEEKLLEKVTSVASLFPHYKKMQIKEEFASKLANGNLLEMDQLDVMEAAENENESQNISDRFLIYDEKGDFKAIYKGFGKKLSVLKMF